MWKFLKKLFGKKPVEQKSGGVTEVQGDAKVIYLYPKNVPVKVQPPIRRIAESNRFESNVREWIKSCREVDALRNKLSVGC